MFILAILFVINMIEGKIVRLQLSNGNDYVTTRENIAGATSINSETFLVSLLCPGNIGKRPTYDDFSAYLTLNGSIEEFVKEHNLFWIEKEEGLLAVNKNNILRLTPSKKNTCIVMLKTRVQYSSSFKRLSPILYHQIKEPYEEVILRGALNGKNGFIEFNESVLIDTKDIVAIEPEGNEKTKVYYKEGLYLTYNGQNMINIKKGYTEVVSKVMAINNRDETT